MKEKIINYVEKWGAVSSIIILALTILSGMRKVYTINHYSISSNFLSFSITDLFYIILKDFLFLFIIFILPYIWDKYIDKDKDIKLKVVKIFLYLACTYSFWLGFMTDMISVCKHQFGFDNLMAISVVTFFIVFCGVWFAYFNVSNVIKNNEGNKQKISNRLFYKLITIPKVVGFAIILVYFILKLLIQFLGEDVVYKTHYDTLMYEGEEHVVLDIMNDNAIIAEYDDNKNIIYTSEYIIVDLKDKVISSVDFKEVPDIK